MGCRILEGTADGTGHGAVFYDSTTGVAFGPLMADGEQAEAFCQWIPGDPRNYSQQELMDKYAEFTRLYVCECGELRHDKCDWCEDFAEEWPLGADGKHHHVDDDDVTECEKEEAPAEGKRFECRRCHKQRERESGRAAKGAR